MTARNDLDRQLNNLLRDGPTELPYQSFDAVRDRTETTRQRVVIGPWRVPEMNKILTIGVGAAAVVVAVFIGAQLFETPRGGLGSDPTPTPHPNATPEASREIPFAVSEPSSGAATTALEAGTYRMRGPGASPPGWPSSVVVTVPDQWWAISVLRGSGLERQHADGSSTAQLRFNSVENLLADPCAGALPPVEHGLLEPPVGSSVDDLVAGLRSLPGLQFTEAVDVTLDGWQGKRLELAQPIPCDATIGLTPADRGESWTISVPEGWAATFWILDVDGLRFVLMAAYKPGAPADVRQDLTQMVDSMDIEP